MPKNRFPDSREKRELRRRDVRLLQAFSERTAQKLSYCGLPSVEFLDVEAWKDVLSAVTAFEEDRDAYEDMLIVRDTRNYPFPVAINPEGTSDILKYLGQATYCYDLYNLDFYGGLVYPRGDGTYRSTDALRRLFFAQANCRRSFVLITTLNVRDCGASEYASFLESARLGLAGRHNVAENIKRHEAEQSTRLKLCFPFFCWQQAHANGFEHVCEDVIVYKSSVTLVHFFQSFDFRGVRLPPLPPTGTLIEMANRPLFEMHGQVKRISVGFSQIS